MLPVGPNENRRVVRVCAAIVRDSRILMVFHRHSARSYWTLPGGSVEPGETPEQAVLREVREETGLSARDARFLFDEPFGDGVCRCFLVTANECDDAIVGFDPEEAHLEPADRLLQDVAWHAWESKRDDGQVAHVIRCLKEATA